MVTHMRERDRREIYALRHNDDDDELVRAKFPLMGAMCCIWERDGVPVSCQGVLPWWPHVWEMFAFGTDLWPRVLLSMTRHALRVIIPKLRAVGAHRVECRALASHTESRRWIEHLGAHEEAILHRYGRAGEDFVLYVWHPD